MTAARCAQLAPAGTRQPAQRRAPVSAALGPAGQTGGQRSECPAPSRHVQSRDVRSGSTRLSPVGPRLQWLQGVPLLCPEAQPCPLPGRTPPLEAFPGEHVSRRPWNWLVFTEEAAFSSAQKWGRVRRGAGSKTEALRAQCPEGGLKQVV